MTCRSSNESLAKPDSSLPSISGTPSHEAFNSGATSSFSNSDFSFQLQKATTDGDMCHYFDMVEGGAPMMSDITDCMAGEAMATPKNLSGYNTPIRGGTPVLSRKKGRRKSPIKPPNVLVYIGKKDRVRYFDAVKRLFSRCVNLECYVIYNLKHEDIFSTPWMDNTALLVVASDKCYDGTHQMFIDYFNSGGRVINFVNNLDESFIAKSKSLSATNSVLPLTYRQWSNITVISGYYEYLDLTSLRKDVELESVAVNSQTGNSVIVKATHQKSKGIMLLCQVKLKLKILD